MGRRGIVGLCALVSVACGDGGSDRDQPWDPEDTARPSGGEESETSSTSDSGTSGTSAGTSSSTTTTTGNDACAPGAVRECICADGLNLGNETCEASGSAWGECVCDGDGSDSTPTTGNATEGEASTGDETSGVADEVCFPGADNAYTTCFPVHTLDPMPDGYDYPEALNGQANYRKPIALLDLMEVPADTMVAANFSLGELAQIEKGRYAIVQPHAVASIQALRDAVGSITVNSGYRSPGYNAGISGSAAHSRHMYGDGFDLAPNDVGLGTLETACTNEGGQLVEYNSHVHCDFRFDDPDEAYFGSAAGNEPELPLYQAAMQEQDGVFTAPATGFDEGEPLRRWTAFDVDGEVLEETIGEAFFAPQDTALVEVVVGAQVSLRASPQSLTAGG